MPDTRKLAARIFLAAAAVAAALAAARGLAPQGALEWVDWLVLPVYVLALLLHKVGIPGLLQHNGLCGWAWCSPTAVGWVAAGVAAACLVALLALGTAWLWNRITRRS